MKATRFDGADTPFGAPDGMTEEECATIHAQVALEPGGYMTVTTAWTPTPAELVKLNLGVPVYLTLITDGLPPMRLTVGHPNEQE